MPDKKKNSEKKYNYILIMRCQKCNTEAEFIGPCIKCGNLTFMRNYVVKEEK